MKQQLDKLKRILPIKTGAKPKKGSLKNIKAVLFDVYGTLLVSSAGDIGASKFEVKEVISAFECAHLSFKKGVDKEQIAQMIIERYKETIAKTHLWIQLKGVKYPEVDIIKIWQKVIDSFKDKNVFTKKKINYKLLALAFEINTNPVWPMPKLKSTLQGLNKKGIYLGIISNAQFFTPIILNYFLQAKNLNGNIPCFEKDLCIYSYERNKAKPSLSLFKKALRELKRYKIKPNEVLFVGNDMLNDIYPAQKVGFKTALFAGDKRSLRLRKEDDQVKGIRSDMVLTEIGQVKAITN